MSNIEIYDLTTDTSNSSIYKDIYSHIHGKFDSYRQYIKRIEDILYFTNFNVNIYFKLSGQSSYNGDCNIYKNLLNIFIKNQLPIYLINILLDRGLDINSKSVFYNQYSCYPFHLSALHFAIYSINNKNYKYYIKLISFLLKKGIDVNLNTNDDDIKYPKIEKNKKYVGRQMAEGLKILNT